MSLLPLNPHLPGALPPDRRATPQPAGGRLRAAPPEGGLHAPLHPPDELSLPISGLTYPNTTLVSDKSRRARQRLHLEVPGHIFAHGAGVFFELHSRLEVFEGISQRGEPVLRDLVVILVVVRLA